MLHKTVLAIAPTEVAGIVEIQIKLLELAASTNSLDSAAVQSWFVQSEVAEWVAANQCYTLEPLKCLAATCPADDKVALAAEVAAELRSDVEFWRHYPDAGFSLRFTYDEHSYRRHIALWLRGFYKQFSQTGIAPCVTGTRLWSKRVWEDAFKVVNPMVQTCPQCDGTMKGGLTAEHIFPREKYPPLSVHPANLIPCCDDCQKWKKNKDPIQNAVPQRLFLPYWQHALDHCDIRATANTKGAWDFTLCSRSQTADWQVAIKELGRLYGIPERWNMSCADIVNLATAKIDEQIDADHADGKVLTSKVELKERLDTLCVRMRRHWGRQHYFVPATAWIAWAKDNMLDQLWQRFGGLTN